jgi:mannosyltransferase
VKQDWEIKPSWLLGLYAVALVARLVDLNSQLWADEYLSLVRYVRLPAWDLFTHFYSNNQHPLYSLLAHATMSVFGEAAWTLRLPAALLGAACVPALYALARRVTTRREAFLTTALLALSYHHVWFSQNGRGYTGIMLGGIVCTTLLLDGLRTPRPRTFILYGLVAGLGAYTHLGMVFIVVGHAAAVAPYLLWKVRPVSRWVWPLAAFPLGAAFTLLFHAPMLGDVIDFFVNKPSPAVGLATPLWAVLETARNLAAGFGGVAAVGAVVVLIIGLAGLVGALSYAKEDPLALALFVAPVVITGLGVMGGRGIVYPRFFFGVAAFAMLIFVRGPFALAERVPALRDKRVGELVIGLLLVASTASVPLNYLRPKQDFEGAMRHIEAKKGPDDVVLCLGIINTIYEGYFRRPWPKVWSEAEIQAAGRGHPNAWVVFMMADYIKHNNPDLMTYVRGACVDKTGFAGTLSGGEIYTCRIPMDAEAAPALDGAPAPTEN